VKDVQYRQLMLRAAQLSSEVYASCGGEGLRCNVLYPLRSPNFQKSDRANSLVYLSSLWVCSTASLCSELRAAQLSSEMYASCGGEGLLCNVLYPRSSPNFQKADRANSLAYLTFLLSGCAVPPAYAQSCSAVT
jgi:hypothetical protein